MCGGRPFLLEFLEGTQLKVLHSLRSQFMTVIVGLTILLMLVMGTLNILSIERYSTRLASMELNWQAQRTAYQIQKLLIQTSDVSHAVTNVMEHHVSDPNRLQDPAYRAEVKDILLHRFRDFVSTNHGISGYYVHFADELVGDSDGFRYTLDPDQGFVPDQNLAPVTAYPYMTPGRNEWYYLPRDRKAPLWMPPHTDKKDNKTVISYVQPIYIQGKFVAVIGLDISMDTLVELLHNASSASDGTAFLFSDNGLLYYHPDYPKGAPTNLNDLNLQAYAKILKNRDSDNNVLPFNYMGQPEELAFVSLENGINLGIAAPKAKIFENRDLTIARSVFMLILLIILTTGLSVLLSNRMVKPLKKIGDAARRVGNGDYDTPLEMDREDEIGELSRNIDMTRQRLKALVSRLRVDALQDKLTSVKNTTAYEAKIVELDDLIRKQAPVAFGLVMIDLNGLKTINDTYGHEKGNEILQATSKAVCDIYKHSPVYRIGGDEFCVVVQNEDLNNWNALWQQLQPYICKRDSSGATPWSQIAIAAGHTLYDPKKDFSFSHVFTRADALMYHTKRHLEGKNMR